MSSQAQNKNQSKHLLKYIRKIKKHAPKYFYLKSFCYAEFHKYYIYLKDNIEQGLLGKEIVF